VRIPLGQTAFIDVWMDGQAERIRTLNLFLRYDPQVLEPLDSDPSKDGVNPFATVGYMPQPSEALNAVLPAEGQLIYGVTNLGESGATGSGIVASFQVQAIGPGPETDVTVDFRYPLNFTSYEIITDQGVLENRDFQTSQVSDLHVLIGAGLIISDIPDLMMPGGDRDRSIVLDDYVVDAIYPDSQMEWSVSGASQVQAQIDENRRVTLQAPDDWSGTERLSFTAKSPDGLEGTDDVVVTVIGPPRLQRGLFGIPDIVMAEDSEHGDFDLDDFLAPDPYNPPEDLSWYAAGQQQLEVRIAPITHQLTLSPSPEWSGEELILFTVSNRFGLADTTSIVVTVAAVNDPPVLEVFAPLTVQVGDELEGPSLEDQVADVDDALDQLSFEISGDHLVAAEIRVGHIVVRGLDAGAGAVEVVVRDPLGAEATDTLWVAVTDTARTPQVAGLPDLILRAGEPFSLSLDEWVTDPDTPDSLLTWSVSSAPVVEAQIAAGRQVLLSAPHGYVGDIEVVLAVSDPEGNSAIAAFAVTVQADTQELVLLLPDEIDLVAGEVREFVLTDVVSSPHASVEELTWEILDAVAIDATIGEGLLEVTALEVDESVLGRMIVSVADPQGNQDIDTVGVRVTPSGGGEDFAVEIPDTALVAGTALTMSLDPFVSGVEASKVTWEMASDVPVGLSARLDAGQRSLELSAEAGSAQTVSVVLRATAPEGQAVEAAFSVEVRPPILSLADIPDTALVAGATLAMPLDPYVEGVEADRITWQIIGEFPDGFTGRIDAAQRTIELVAEPSFAQTVSVALRATAPGGQVAEGAFAASVLPPGLILADIPNVELRAGEPDSSLTLDPYVLQGDPSTLTWSVEGATFVAVQIDAVHHRVRMWAPDGTTGTEVLVFSARDRAGQTASGEVQARVQQVWELAEIPDVYLLPGESAVLRLDEYVLRGTPAQLIWSVTGATAVQVEIDAQTRFARLVAPEGGPTHEELVLRALTPGGESLEGAFQVEVLPPPLRLRPMPDIFLSSGQVDSSRVLDAYVESGDPAAVQWAVEAADDLAAHIDSSTRKLHVSTLGDFTGQRTLILTATRNGQTAAGALLVVVQESPPVLQIGDIPDLALVAGQVDSSLVLDRYVEIGDPELVEWSVEGSDRIEAQIDRATRRAHLQAVEAFAEESLVFVARLEGESARDTVRVSSEEEPVRIELGGIPPLTIVQGTVDTSVVLDSYLVQGDPAIAKWSIAGGILVRATIDSTSRRLHVDARVAQVGVEVFYLEVTQGAAAASGVLRVGVRAAEFAIASLPLVEIESGGPSVSLNLESYVQGDFSPNQIEWEARPSDQLVASVDSVSHALELEPTAGFSGSAQLVLIAYTPLGESRQVTLQVEVAEASGGALEIAALPRLAYVPGTVVAPLRLDDYIAGEDPANLTWRVVDTGMIGLSINAQTHILTVHIPQDFRGEENRRLGARRLSGGVETQVELRVAAIAGDLAPVLSLPEEIVVAVGQVVEVDLYGLVEDGDTDDSLLSWSVRDDDGLEIQVDTFRGQLILLAREYHDTPARVYLTAVDPEGHQAEGFFRVRLLDVDTTGPALRLEVGEHEIYSNRLSIRVYADEVLRTNPVVHVGGEQLEVEAAGDHYRAAYVPDREGVLNIAVSGMDLRGNPSYLPLPITVKWLDQMSSTAFSPDGRLQVNVGQVMGGPLAALVYEASLDNGEERAYYVDIVGVGEPHHAVEIVFLDIDPGEGNDLVVMHRGQDGLTWDEITTHADGGDLWASAAELGLFRVAASTVGNRAEGLAAFPNPFNTETAIQYVVRNEGRVRVEVYDLQGHRIRLLVNRVQGGGPWSAVWNGEDGNGVTMASGVYLYVVETVGERRTGKMTLLR